MVNLKKNSYSLDECGRQIFAIASYIDFFLHDMLDFSVLSEKAENFVRTIENIDLEETFNFMYEIFHEKLELRKIKMKFELSGSNSIR